MPDTPALALFLAAALALLLTPGPAVLYIVARSVEQGRRAGVASALGVGLGSLCHVLAAALGLSAILVSSALAFSAVKYAGAAYLIYLGIRALRERDENGPAVPPAPRRLSSIFVQGVVVNLLNPKTALFFFAFLPQFVDSARGSVVGQVLFLGCLFVTLGICSDSLYALAAGTVARRIRETSRFRRNRRRFTGGVYIALGVTTAFAGSGRK